MPVGNRKREARRRLIQRRKAAERVGKKCVPGTGGGRLTSSTCRPMKDRNEYKINDTVNPSGPVRLDDYAKNVFLMPNRVVYPVFPMHSMYSNNMVEQDKIYHG